jgi:hypothetical protein
MRNRRIIVLCLIGVALVFIALFAYNPTSGEPSYDGLPLSYWVTSLSGNSITMVQLQNATNAFDHIGPAALPFLVKWIQYEPPQWRTRLGNWLNRTPFPGDQLSQWVEAPRAWRLAVGSHEAFSTLGKRAMPVLEDLCRLMNNTNSPYTAGQAAAALAFLGTNAFPPLLEVAKNARHPSRLAAIGAIGRISDLGQAAQLAIPAITDCLAATNTHSQVIAIIALGNLKVSPETSVPTLVSSLKHPNAYIRLYSANALGQFGPLALSAIPALTNALADLDQRVRERAAAALKQIDPATFTNATSQ